MRQILSALALVAFCLALGCGSAAAQREELQNSKIEVKYVPPENSKFTELMERLQRREVLEDLKAFLSPLRLPRKLTLLTKQCDTVNAFYARGEGLILCYEYLELIEKLAPKETTPEGFTRREGLAGTFAEVAFHETGHAVFDMFDVPIFGREEDAADQAAAFVMVHFSPEVTRLAIKGAAYSYISQDTEWSRTKFADEHGTQRQRYYNYLCLAYGANPTEFQDFVDKGMLPKERAVHCNQEYEQVRRAFQKTVQPFLDQDMMKKVPVVRWFRDDDGK
jgi:hypothetical protein